MARCAALRCAGALVDRVGTALRHHPYPPIPACDPDRRGCPQVGPLGRRGGHIHGAGLAGRDRELVPAASAGLHYSTV